MKKILTITVLIIALLFIGGCAKSDDEIILSIDDGGSAIFKTTDMALLPILGAVPVEGEAIEKVIVLKFSNATKVGIAFENEGSIPQGLMYSIDEGDAHRWQSGEVYAKDVRESDTELRVKLKVWLSGDAPIEIAGTVFQFNITAMAE